MYLYQENVSKFILKQKTRFLGQGVYKSKWKVDDVIPNCITKLFLKIKKRFWKKYVYENLKWLSYSMVCFATVFFYYHGNVLFDRSGQGWRPLEISGGGEGPREFNSHLGRRKKHCSLFFQSFSCLLDPNKQCTTLQKSIYSRLFDFL